MSTSESTAAMALADFFVVDELTVSLLLVLVAVYLVSALYKPQPLVHPILLGRQSDASRVRNPTESAVYRNYGTGMLGRLPARPSKEVQTVSDLVKADFDAPRSLWNTKITNEQLLARVSAFGTGLINATGLSANDHNVLLLLNDGLEFIIADLALAKHGIPSFTLTSPTLLTAVLASHPPDVIITHVTFAKQLVELLAESCETEHHTLVLVGDGDIRKDLPHAAQRLKVLSWSSLEDNGAKAESLPSVNAALKDIYSVSVFLNKSGVLGRAHITHQNLTAGVAAARTLLPLSNALTPSDTIVSAHTLSSAYGRAIAYTALYEGTNFKTAPSTRMYGLDEGQVTRDVDDILPNAKIDFPSPTLLFVTPSHVHSLTAAIMERAQQYPLFSLAQRHKLTGISHGFLTKESLWDRIVFDKARQVALGGMAATLRGVVVSGGPLDALSITPTRIALSIPFVLVYSHPLVAGPLFATHPLDLQIFPPLQPSATAFLQLEASPVGPPAVNVEVKLCNVDDNGVEAGGDPAGAVWARGPSICGPVSTDGDSAVDSEDAGWVEIGAEGLVQTNGSFKVVHTDSHTK